MRVFVQILCDWAINCFENVDENQAAKPSYGRDVAETKATSPWRRMVLGVGSALVIEGFVIQGGFLFAHKQAWEWKLQRTKCGIKTEVWNQKFKRKSLRDEK